MSTDDHDQIVADYLAGNDIADIERRYDVTRDEIEWLVAQHRKATSARSRPAVKSDTPPAPVFAAVVLAVFGAMAHAVTTFAILLMAPGSGDDAGNWLPGAIVNGYLAYGLWRGWRGAQVIAVISVCCSIVGLFVAPLVVVPRSARAWFWSTRP